MTPVSSAARAMKACSVCHHPIRPERLAARPAVTTCSYPCAQHAPCTPGEETDDPHEPHCVVCDRIIPRQRRRARPGVTTCARRCQRALEHGDAPAPTRAPRTPPPVPPPEPFAVPLTEEETQEIGEEASAAPSACRQCGRAIPPERARRDLATCSPACDANRNDGLPPCNLRLLDLYAREDRVA